MKVDVRKIQIAQARKCLTIKSLAYEIGVTAACISAIFKRGITSFETAVLLAETLNINVEEIIKVENPVGKIKIDFNKLKKIQLKAQITTKELSKKAGLSQHVINDLESRNTSLAAIGLLARALNVDVTEIVKDVNEAIQLKKRKDDSKDIYALYKGEKFLEVGTIQHIAQKLNMTKTAVKYYGYDCHLNKLKDRNSENAKILIKVE